MRMYNRHRSDTGPAGRVRPEPAVHLVHRQARRALEPVVDVEVGVQVGDGRRRVLHARQRPADAGQQPALRGEAGGAQDVVTDLVRQHLGWEVAEAGGVDLLEVDDDELVGQADHGEAVLSPASRAAAVVSHSNGSRSRVNRLHTDTAPGHVARQSSASVMTRAPGRGRR